MKTKYKVLLAIFLSVLFFSGYKVISIKQSYIKAENEYEDLQTGGFLTVIEDTTEKNSEDQEEEEETHRVPNQRLDLATLKSINGDCIGWIQIPDTLISYPLVAGDMDYYLKHTFRGNYSNAGSIFIDENNSPSLEDPHTIIYGHNMYSYGMFTDLENYVDYDFWKDHQYVYIWTASGQHCYQVFSCYTAYDTDRAYTVGYQHDEIFGELVEYMSVNSRYDTEIHVCEDDTVITLSTCYNNNNIRYLVHAVHVS